MEDTIRPTSYFQYPPPPPPPPHRPSPSDRDRYMTDLICERQKLVPFTEVLPICTRLINEEIRRTSHFLEHERVELGSPFRSLSHSYGTPMEENGHGVRMQYSPMGWPGVHGIPASPLVKKVIRLDVPVDKYPNFNFVGRILGPRGNSLKRVEAITSCRVYIRGRGSVKDAVKEEKLKDKSGFEHLNEPLHVLVEAEFPEHIIDSRLDKATEILETLLRPMDESLDHYKKSQLRELAILNGTLREDSPTMMSPFNNTGMKRAKTGI